MYGDQFGEFVCGYWGLKGSYDKKSPFVRKSKKILEILDLDSRDWIPGFLPGELGFRIPIASGSPLSLGRIPDSKGQDSRLHQQNFRILHSKCKNFPDFAIQNSLTRGEKTVLRDR